MLQLGACSSGQAACRAHGTREQILAPPQSLAISFATPPPFEKLTQAREWIGDETNPSVPTT